MLTWIVWEQVRSPMVTTLVVPFCKDFPLKPIPVIGKSQKFQSLNGVSQHYQDVTWIPSEKWPSWRDWDVVCLAHTQSFVFKKNWRRPKDGSKMTDLSLTCTHNSDWMAHHNRTGLKCKQLLNHYNLLTISLSTYVGSTSTMSEIVYT